MLPLLGRPPAFFVALRPAEGFRRLLCLSRQFPPILLRLLPRFLQLGPPPRRVVGFFLRPPVLGLATALLAPLRALAPALVPLLSLYTRDLS